jgi:hypothetical protein
MGTHAAGLRGQAAPSLSLPVVVEGVRGWRWEPSSSSSSLRMYGGGARGCNKCSEVRSRGPVTCYSPLFSLDLRP